MKNVANCKNGKTRLISVAHWVKTIDSARRETKPEKKKFVEIVFKYISPLF